jgi:hypothetical protein
MSCILTRCTYDENLEMTQLRSNNTLSVFQVLAPGGQGKN